MGPHQGLVSKQGGLNQIPYATEVIDVFYFWSVKRDGSRISHRRGHQCSRKGCQHTNMPDFSKKLHEIKKMLVHRGVHMLGAPLGSATG